MAELKIVLKKIITDILSKVLGNQYITSTKPEQHIIVNDDGSIRAEYANQPDFFGSFWTQALPYIDGYDIGPLTSIIETEHPILNGTMGSRQFRKGYAANNWVEQLILNILKNPPDKYDMEKSISKEIDEFISMITNKTYTTNLYFPIDKFFLPSAIKKIDFSDNMCVKTLSAEELTFLFSNRSGILDIGNMPRTAAVVIYEDDIIFEKNDQNLRTSPIDNIESQISKLVHSLNLTLPGSKGIVSRYYNYQGYFSNFVGLFSNKSPERINGINVTLEINQEDIWKNKYEMLNSHDMSPFSFALDKLGSAEIRLDERDAIVDAVIGLESLLLNDIGNEKTRGELRYRYSINYSTLFPSEMRFEKYKLAREGYDLRSLIVHAAKRRDEEIEFQGNKIPIGIAKESIIEMLRFTINTLIELYHTTPFNRELFWLYRVLGIESETK